MRIFIILIACFFYQTITAQEVEDMKSDLPYDQIPDYPKEYNACTVAARMIDGLGFRYYWATEGLRPEDLNYKPSEDARTCMETIEHLQGLSQMVINAVQNKANIRPQEELKLTFEQRRKITLQNLHEASQILKQSNPKDIEQYKIIFQRGDTQSEFPFWHHLNGPIADALWHAGQIVAFRRSSGNPINPKVNVFMGKVKE